MVEYIEQSREHYKGFDLVIELFSLDHIRTHRRCVVYADGKSIAIGKTKKECKEIIDDGLYDKYKEN